MNIQTSLSRPAAQGEQRSYKTDRSALSQQIEGNSARDYRNSVQKGGGSIEEDQFINHQNMKIVNAYDINQDESNSQMMNQNDSSDQYDDNEEDEQFQMQKENMNKPNILIKDAHR